MVMRFADMIASTQLLHERNSSVEALENKALKLADQVSIIPLQVSKTKGCLENAAAIHGYGQC